MKPREITDDSLRGVVPDSNSVYDVLRRLHLSISGNSHKYMKLRIQRLGIDTDHFLSGPKVTAENTRLDLASIFVYDRLNGRRERPSVLRRALFESGVSEQCAICGLGAFWNEKPLKLEVDHINRDRYDNRFENLRLLCPNCHSQH